MNTERLKVLLAQNGIFIALIALITFFALMNSNFLSTGNAGSILLQSVELGLIALPVAFLIISGTIDFSVGSTASLAGVVSAMTMSATQSIALGVLVGLLVGATAGAINGFLISYLGLNPFVVTLGFLSVWAGLALLITNGRAIPGADLPSAFRKFSSATFGPLPIPILLLLGAVIAAWYVLNRTAFGRQVLAIGGNRRAAELMGVSVRGVQFTLFVATGVGAALAGMLFATKVQTASPIVGVGLEFDALTVVLLGGVAMSGGIGRVSSVVAGLLFFRVLRNGLAFLQASPFLQTLLIGATLVIAVALDSSVQRILKTSWAKLGRRSDTAEAPASQPALSRRS